MEPGRDWGKPSDLAWIALAFGLVLSASGGVRHFRAGSLGWVAFEFALLGFGLGMAATHLIWFLRRRRSK
jgi:hypothetical protein